MKKWILKHPYSITGLIFLMLMGFGGWYLGWNEQNLAFLLLLYLIVSLGIRLDDISRQIAAGSVGAASPLADETEHLHGQLNEIRTSLAAIQGTLQQIRNQIDREVR